jgi:hypothetical protein
VKQSVYVPFVLRRVILSRRSPYRAFIVERGDVPILANEIPLGGDDFLPIGTQVDIISVLEDCGNIVYLVRAPDGRELEVLSDELISGG